MVSFIHVNFFEGICKWASLCDHEGCLADKLKFTILKKMQKKWHILWTLVPDISLLLVIYLYLWKSLLKTIYIGAVMMVHAR